MTFFEKYELLKKSVPVSATGNDSQTVDSDYCVYMISSKNCYFCMGNFLEDCIYVRLSAFSNMIVHGVNVTQSEKCYECFDSNKCHSCTYLMDCINSTDCHFSAFLNNCTDCFGSVALTHKKYCIFNKQFTKEEYLERLEELKKETPASISPIKH